ncbi:MAG: translation initiation factor IF-2 [bacterium]|nr:translation initiation factor IF-2 [bacterium]
MNVTELARRLRVTPHELLEKLPVLGFDIGRRAIKVDNRMADKIMRTWNENARRERLRDKLVVGSKKVDPSVPVEVKRVQLPLVVTVRDFAGKLNLPVTRVIQELMKSGILAAQNERLDFETAAIIAEQLGYEATPEEANAQSGVQEMEKESDDKLKDLLAKDEKGDCIPRPPIIVVMGHVDHGKTKTLDAIRSTNVTEGEQGGITQHIGAYQIVKKDRKMTFIDTPGHEAFTVMRSRGARVADIAILVVAADDGVQPQTVEALNIIKAAKLPFIVAMNKMDKEEADPERVLAGLSEQGVTTEEWGGTVPIVKISAKNGTGIDDLLDILLLVADMNAETICANPNRHAVGTIVESHVDKGEGPVATVLIQTGTLKLNDHLGIDDAAYGRVRAMRDWNGDNLTEATPGTPVKILGFKVAPSVGDILQIPDNPKDLKVKKIKSSYQVASQLSATKTIQPESSSDEGKKSRVKLNIVLRTDVLGSLEALLGMLEKVKDEDVAAEVIQKGLGNITEGDILRAETSQPSVLYGFNVVLTPKAKALAVEKDVDVATPKTIYELYDDVVRRLNELVPPETFVEDLGSVEVAAIFRTETDRMVVGCRVKEGKVVSGERIRVWRGEDPIGEGIVDSLQTGKQSSKECHAGQECGISFKGKTKIEVGDRLEIYHQETKKREFTMQR